MNSQRTFTILVEQTSPDYWVAICEDLPRVVAGGPTREQAFHDMRRKIQIYLDCETVKNTAGSKIELTI